MPDCEALRFLSPSFNKVLQTKGPHMRKVIGLHYTMKNDAGEVLETTQGGHPMLYLSGSDQVLAALDAVFIELSVGDKKTISLAPKDGYGEVNPALKKTVDVKAFPAEADVRPGYKFRASDKAGSPTYRVVKILGTQAFIDGNHPLAGETLHFDVEITEARDATEEEISHGHAHGPGGHHH